MEYSQFEEALQQLGWAKVDGAFLDLGVSSLSASIQRKEGSVLEMTDHWICGWLPKGSINLPGIFVNRSSYDELKILHFNSWRRTHGRQDSQGNCFLPAKSPIDGTLQLAEIVARAYPASWRRKSRRHPATRTFQAIRMAVNEELKRVGNFFSAKLSIGF